MSDRQAAARAVLAERSRDRKEEAIRWWREGFSKERIADLLDVSLRSVQRYLHGITR